MAAANDESAARAREHLRGLVGAAEALGCYTVVPKHFRVLQRLADHGVFAAGAIVVGTHAFLGYQNLLGVRWADAGSTVDLDFADPGRNVSLALAPDARVDAHSAVDSLRMGFVPVKQGTRYVKPDEPDFDLDWLTVRTRQGDAPVRCEALNVWLQPLRFMELSLEAPVPAALMSSSAAVVVNLPRPEVYAVHKLLVLTERSDDQASKARKDLAQAAALLACFVERDPDALREVLHATRERGPAWRSGLDKGLRRLRGPYADVHRAIEALA
ncbi:GSU2403 family nucleotidyltransferase fold protein [Caldimonas sp. KR1-144]|uniref:GSU2403 family nucleotidyltransferase fold protein n=1 Tax=Caldimonas sp. KR1-144 TaxID=3400911 RepID=UPI003C025CC3